MEFKKLFAAVLWLIGIICGLVAIFRIIPNVEIAVGFVTISFGILAIIWTSIAYQNLSKGSSLKDYVGSFLFCLVFIMLFSIWHTLELIFLWKGIIVMLKYIFITSAYLIFSYSAFKIWKIGKEFGFKDEAKNIRQVIKEKKEQH